MSTYAKGFHHCTSLKQMLMVQRIFKFRKTDNSAMRISVVGVDLRETLKQN